MKVTPALRRAQSQALPARRVTFADGRGQVAPVAEREGSVHGVMRMLERADKHEQETELAQAAKDLPPGWEARRSRAGGLYYVETSTGTSTWDKPTKPAEDRTKPTDMTSEGIKFRKHQPEGSAGSAHQIRLQELDRGGDKTGTIAETAEAAAIGKTRVKMEPAPVQAASAASSTSSASMEPAGEVRATGPMQPHHQVHGLRRLVGSTSSRPDLPSAAPTGEARGTEIPGAPPEPAASSAPAHPEPAPAEAPDPPQRVEITVEKIPTAGDPSVDRYSLVIKALPAVFDHIVVQQYGSGNVGNFWQSVKQSLDTT